MLKKYLTTNSCIRSDTRYPAFYKGRISGGRISGPCRKITHMFNQNYNKCFECKFAQNANCFSTQIFHFVAFCKFVIRDQIEQY